MVLNDNDIKKLIQEPENATLIRQGIEHEARLNALANGVNPEIILREYAEMHVPELRSMIISKFNMHAVPFLSVGTGTVYSHFQKVFDTADGRDEFYYFEDTAEMVDFLNYLNEIYLPLQGVPAVSQNEFYKSVVAKDMLYNPNTKYIMEFPDVANETKPYIVRVPITKILDIAEENNRVKYLITKQYYDQDGKELTKLKGNSSYILYRVYDSANYSVYRQNSELSTPILVSQNAHNLGYCPVWSASNYNFSTDSTSILKKSPISDSVSDIYNWTLIKNIAKYYNWQKGSPPSTGIVVNCKYSNTPHPQYGVTCNKGFYTTAIDNEIDSNGKPKFRVYNCKDCEQRRKEKFHLGKQVDIFYEDIFTKNGANADVLEIVRKSLGHIDTNTNYLEVISTWLDKQEAKIKGHITGEGFNQVQSKEAFNKEYISVSTDDKQNNLSVFATNIELLQKSIESAIAYTRYFSFQGMYVNYGRGYFLKSANEAQKEIFELAERSGDVYTLLNKMSSLQKNEKQGDIVMQTLGQIVLAVVPYCDLPIQKVIENRDKLVTNLMTELQYLVRINAIAFLQEFILLEKSRLFASGGLRTLHNRLYNFFYLQAYRLRENKIEFFIPQIATEVYGKENNNNAGQSIGQPNGQPNSGEFNGANN